MCKRKHYLNLRIPANLIRISFAAIMLCLTSCTNEHLDELPIGQQNAIWVQSTFLRGYHPSTKDTLNPNMIVELGHTLKKHKVKYAYLFAGPYGYDGHLPSYPFSEKAVQTVKLLRRVNPELIVLPWVGGIQNKTVQLEDSLWVANAVYDTKRLINRLNVPGIHIDLEFLLQGDDYLDETIVRTRTSEDLKNYGTNVNRFHRKLRQAIPSAFISSVVVPPLKYTAPWKRKTSVKELGGLIPYVDQLSFLFYDTRLNKQTEFNSDCNQLMKIIKTLSDKRDIEYLIAVGTFINEPQLRKYRDLRIESVPNTLSTIKYQVRNLNSNKIFIDGIALYCEWLMTEGLWNQFDENWSHM